MTQINRFVKREPLEFNLYKPPAQAFLPLFEKLDKKYTESRQTADAILASARVPHLEQDARYAIEYTNSVYDRVDQILKQHGNNYLAAYDDLMNLKQQVIRETSPGTQPYTIVQNYETFLKADEENRKALAEGKITQAQYDGFRNYAKTAYKGAQPVGEYGFERLVLPSIVPYVNVDAIADAEFKTIPVRTRKEPTYSYDEATGHFVIKEVVRKYVDRDEASKAIKHTLEANPAITQFLRQQALFEGSNPDEAVDKYIQDYLDKQVPVRTGLIERSEDIKLQFNPLAKDDGGDATVVTINTATTGFTGMVSPPPSAPVAPFDPTKVDPSKFYTPQQIESFRKELETRQWQDYKAALKGLASGGMAGTGGGMLLKGLDRKAFVSSAYPKVQKLIDPNVVLNDAASNAHVVNIPLLRSIVANTPGNPGDPSYLANVWNTYNANVGKSFSNAITRWNFATEDARAQATKNIIERYLNDPNVPIFKLDRADGTITPILATSSMFKHDRKDVIKELAVIDSATGTLKGLKAGSQVLGVALPATGGVPLSYVVKGEKYDYFIPVDDVAVLDFNFGKTNLGNIQNQDYITSTRYNAFAFYHYARESGFPFKVLQSEVDAKGRPTGKTEDVWLVGRLLYEPTGQGSYNPKVVYYRGKWENGKFVTDFSDRSLYRVNGKVVDPFMLQEMLVAPLIETHFIPKQSASRQQGAATQIEPSHYSQKIKTSRQ